MVDFGDLIKEWWDTYQPDPRALYERIVSGMRDQPDSSGESKYSGGAIQKVSTSQMQTGSCQYWIKGLSAICSYWEHEPMQCSYLTASGVTTASGIPSGYGTGSCDRLGRRDWCNRYTSSADTDLEEFVCIAPSIEKSGLGKQVSISGSQPRLNYRPLNIDEIKGYNVGENGAGRCDGWGMGRGKLGYTYIEDIYWDRPVCRQYRPQQMGFGAVQPRPFHGSEKPGHFKAGVNWIPDNLKDLHDSSLADPLTRMEVRLPYAFQVYNSRAMYQKCAHWQGPPGVFEIDYFGTDPSHFDISMLNEQFCEHESSSFVDPYREYSSASTSGLPFILQNVWADYGGIVCNGAKPECPCYTGKWVYCTDNTVRDGMRITADQIFELRFWESNWSSQVEYDDHYRQKPGPTTQDGYADESTADIYTFTYWNKLVANDPNESIMIGNRHHMCMPAPLHMREFDPEVYVTTTQVEYPRAGQYQGTNLEGSKVAYPTLARELEDPAGYVPDVLITYPYSVLDPWEVYECDDNDYEKGIHDSNLMTDPFISVIGQSSLDSSIFVINANLYPYASKAFTLMDEYARGSNVPDAQWETYCTEIEGLITSCYEEDVALFEDSTDEYGFFQVTEVELELNKLNVLYVICKYDEPTTLDYPYYTFRKVEVISRYWGALIDQNTATHTHSGNIWSNHFPFYTSSGYNINGTVLKTRGTVQTVFSVYSYYHQDLYDPTAYYSYCINEYEVPAAEIEQWAQVGSTGYIWVELDDVEISYLWDFEVITAYISPKENSELGLCGLAADDITSIRIELEQVYPTPGSSTQRRQVPPSAVLLRADSPMPFFNNDWTLTLSYKYQRLEPFQLNSVWPTGTDDDFAINKFVDSPFEVSHVEGDLSFIIPSAGAATSRGSIKVMACIQDELGRIQTAAATKLLIQGNKLGCRSVDILYRYAADALGYDLQPSSGFFTWRGSPSVNPASGEGIVHGRNAKCGDHECAPSNCIGPVWFPFNDCTTDDFYDIYTGAAQCTMPITEGEEEIQAMGNGAWRYCTADEYKAWVTVGGNWVSTCGTSFYYHYSKAASSGMRFTGRANKKAKIDLWYYLFMGWVPPPFGNKGRGYVERYLSRDYVSYIDLSGPRPVTLAEYMPMVFDMEDLIIDMNCFHQEDQYSELHEPFVHMSMLNSYTGNFIDEEVSSTRYRFEEIIEPVYHGSCMYPFPLIPYGGSYRVIRYGFKEEKQVWAWPELWRSLERNIASTNGKFHFLGLTLPDYYFDFNKEEHRLVIDEGEWVITFSPPVEEEDDEEGVDSKSSVYPSISINGEHPRYFKLIYNSYTTANVEWQDEAKTGEEGSSGGAGEGADEGSIYEEANNGASQNGPGGDNTPQWMHDFDTLFAPEATIETSDDRKALIGVDDLYGDYEYSFYNRGLIVNIPRNRLQYLPVKLEDAGEPILEENATQTEILGFWSMEGVQGAALTIRITGMWGVDETETEYSKPKVLVVESDEAMGEGLEWPEDLDTIAYLQYDPGSYKDEPGLEAYSIEIELSRSPSRIAKKWSYFMVKLTPAPAEKLYVQTVLAETGYYIEATETVRVWERKYLAGEVDLPVMNADGPETNRVRAYHRDLINAGQYFPFEDQFEADEDTDFEQGGKVLSKLNMVGFTDVFREDEEINVTMTNLKYVEANAQKDLYEEAYSQDDYDELSYSGVLPPVIRQWLEKINATMGVPTRLVLTYGKVDWEHNNLKNLLRQEGNFWQPGGHYFAWSNSAIRTRCYVFGPIQTVYDVDWVHNKHGGTEATLDAGTAYAGWGRLEYYEGTLWNLGLLGKESNQNVDVLTGAKNFMYNQSR